MSLDQVLRELVREEVRAALAEVLTYRGGHPDDELTVADAARTRGMSQSWLRQRIAAGDLPVRRYGRAVRIRRADLDALGRRERRRVDDPRDVALRILRGGRR